MAILLILVGILVPIIQFYTRIIPATRTVEFHPSIRHYVVWPDETPASSRLPNLSEISWPNQKRPNITAREMVADLEGFDMKMSPGQYETMQILIRKFSEIMVSLKLQDKWFLGSGTLLGSLQHHDLIPWDEDADFGVHLKYRPLIQEAFKKLPPEFGYYFQYGKDKLFFKPFNSTAKIDANTIGSFGFWHKPWAWPFIDIFYYREIDDEWGEEFIDSVRHKFHLKDIYPVTYRPFGKNWYPAPRKPISFLRDYYRTKQQYCSSHSYSHALERITIPSYIECRTLMNTYPFVTRCPLPLAERDGNSKMFCDEYLINGQGHVVHKLRTVLDSDEIDVPFYTVKHEDFKCPQ